MKNVNGKIGTTAAVLGGIGVGAGLMYLLDPDRGMRRRALIRNKAVGISNDVRHAVEKRTTDLGNRAYGLIHEAKELVEHPVIKDSTTTN